MKSLFQIFTVLFLFAISNLPASATPPDSISLKDTVFGVSATHVFILRETRDNLGLHIFGMTDTYLVAKNIETGHDETIWPIYRQHGGHTSDGEDYKITHFPLEGAVNPYQILADHDALQIDYGFKTAEDIADKSSLTSETLTMAGYAIDTSEAFAQMHRSIEMTSEAIQPYSEGDYNSMTFHTPQEMLAETVLETEYCEISGAQHVNPIYGMPEVQLVQIYCVDDENPMPVSLFVMFKVSNTE